MPWLLCVPAWAQNPVAVHVVDDKGAPVALAQVEFWAWGEHKMILVNALTDAKGDASASLALKSKGDQAAGQVTVHAPGFAPAGGAIKGGRLELHLERGVTWRGKVVDEAGQPIEGAQVGISTASAKGAALFAYVNLGVEKIQEAYTASTAKDGTFKIEDLPDGGEFSFSVTHAKYARAGGTRTVGAEEKVITLSPGAGVRGQLLDLNGALLAKTDVFAQSTDMGRGYGSATSDGQGHFQIDGLAPGDYNVMVKVPKESNFLVPAARVNAKVGTVEIAPLRAVEGVVVRGIVRDATTKKPVEGAQIGVYGPDRPQNGAAITSSETTKSDGAFGVRVVPGSNKFYVYMMPKGYLQGTGEDQQTLDIGAAAPAPLVFELKPAFQIAGTIVDEQGRPIKAQLLTWGQDNTIQSDEAGKWHYSPSTTSPFDLGAGDAEDGYFELLSPVKVSPPVTAPIVVRMRKQPWQSLRGRVLSSDGQPVAGATIKGSFLVEIGDEGALNSFERQTTSDAEGRFELPRIRASGVAEHLEVHAEKSGFTFASGGDIKPDGKGWTMSDIQLLPLNRSIEGTTTPGARVVAAGRETLADATGHFAFKDLPSGDISAFAAKDGQFGQALAAPGKPVQIVLQPQQMQGVDAALGREIWRQALEDAQGKDYYAVTWLVPQPGEAGGEDNLETLKRMAGEPSTPAHDRQMVGLIKKTAPQLQKSGQLAALDAAFAAISIRELRLSAMLDAALVTRDKTLGQRALAEAGEVLPTRPPDNDWREPNLYRLALVEENLNGEDAGSKALNTAIQWTIDHRPAKEFREKNGSDPGRDQWLSWEAPVVAEGSPALLKHLISTISPDEGRDVYALGEAIPVVARAHGIEAALPLLEQLRQMPRPNFEGTSHASNNEPDYAFGQAARRLIPILGEQSPQRALELARRVSNEQHRNRALAGAARFQKGEEAAKLWREIVGSANTTDAPRFAAQAWQIDPKLGLELFDIARQKVESEMKQDFAQRNSWPGFAFYYARVDPAAARLILEREWAKSQANQFAGAQRIAMAMSAVDARRADEMARQIPDKKFESPEARRKIGQYLQTSQDLRRDLPFDRWNASDTWTPGDPEW